MNEAKISEMLMGDSLSNRVRRLMMQAALPPTEVDGAKRIAQQFELAEKIIDLVRAEHEQPDIRDVALVRAALARGLAASMGAMEDVQARGAFERLFKGMAYDEEGPMPEPRTLSEFDYDATTAKGEPELPEVEVARLRSAMKLAHDENMRHPPFIPEKQIIGEMQRILKGALER